MSTTVDTARDQLFKAAEKGTSCPCCDQFVKVYRRKLNSTMARALIFLYQHFQRHDEWLHVPSFLAGKTGNSAAIRGGDWAKLLYWDLIIPMGGPRKDGSKRNGYYKITDRGRNFVTGRISVPKYAYVYNQAVLGLSDGAKYPQTQITIQEAVGEDFNYSELMGN